MLCFQEESSEVVRGADSYPPASIRFSQCRGLVRLAKNWCLRLCDAATAITEPPRSRWIDALRKLQPQGPLWIFWDYEFGRWPADKGMRLDPLLLSPTISKSRVNGGVERSVRGEENASDQAPASIVLT